MTIFCLGGALVKRIIFILLSAFLLLPLGSCSKNNESLPNDFFIWMNGYIAAPVNSIHTFSLTYYYDINSKHLIKDNISRISWLGIENKINIIDFYIDDMDLENFGDYSAYSVALKSAFSIEGIYHCNSLRIELTDGSDIIYPIGELYFDIDLPEPVNPVIDTWRSPVASSNSQEFVYDYKLLNVDSKIYKIKFESNNQIVNTNGISPNNTVDINANGSPVFYCKPKIIVETNGIRLLSYGQGSYCGALDLSGDEIVQSRSHARIIQQK